MGKLVTAIRLGLIALSTFSMATAYSLWVHKNDLEDKVAQQEAIIKNLQTTRERDDFTVGNYVRATQDATRVHMERQQQLYEVPNETRPYLDTVVPDSVRRLFD